MKLLRNWQRLSAQAIREALLIRFVDIGVWLSKQAFHVEDATVVRGKVKLCFGGVTDGVSP